MKTREQYLEEQIERMDQNRDQYSKELNIVADLIKERDKWKAAAIQRMADCHSLRIELERVSKAAAEMRDALEVARAKLDSGGSYGIEWATVVQALRSDAGKDYIDMADVKPLIEALKWYSKMRVMCARAQTALAYAKSKGLTQSPEEPPASTSGTAVPVEAGPAPCASDPPACDTSSNTPSGLTTVPDTVACKSRDVPRTRKDIARIFRNDRVLYESQQDACVATPPTGGMPDNGGALQA